MYRKLASDILKAPHLLGALYFCLKWYFVDGQNSMSFV